MQEALKSLSYLLGQPSYPYGMATVTATEGSSYRRPGARMLLSSDGVRSGAISGGCLEEDMIVHLQAVMKSGHAKTLLYDTTQENDVVWGVGLGCNGKVTLLLERLNGPSASLVFAADAVDRRRRGCVLVTVYACDGADHSLLGTRMAIAEDGPCWEDMIREDWRKVLADSARSALGRASSISQHFPDLTGSPSVFFEYVPPTPQLLIVGAGDDAQPLARFAGELGWSVTVADPRPAFATVARFPTARAVFVVQPENVANQVPIDAHTFAIVMTHHYVHDRPFLAQLINQPLAYLGLLGPRKRADRILQEITQAGVKVTSAALARLHAPVGLDLGGDAPEAVALSMLAEMQAVLQGRDAAPLRLRSRPIHE